MSTFLSTFSAFVFAAMIHQGKSLEDPKRLCMRQDRQTSFFEQFYQNCRFGSALGNFRMESWERESISSLQRDCCAPLSLRHSIIPWKLCPLNTNLSGLRVYYMRNLVYSMVLICKSLCHPSSSVLVVMETDLLETKKTGFHLYWRHYYNATTQKVQSLRLCFCFRDARAQWFELTDKVNERLATSTAPFSLFSWLKAYTGHIFKFSFSFFQFFNN